MSSPQLVLLTMERLDVLHSFHVEWFIMSYKIGGGDKGFTFFYHKIARHWRIRLHYLFIYPFPVGQEALIPKQCQLKHVSPDSDMNKYTVKIAPLSFRRGGTVVFFFFIYQDRFMNKDSFTKEHKEPSITLSLFCVSLCRLFLLLYSPYHIHQTFCYHFYKRNSDIVWVIHFSNHRLFYIPLSCRPPAFMWRWKNKLSL